LKKQLPASYDGKKNIKIGKRMRINRGLRYLFALSAIACLASLTACGSGDYKTFSIKEGPQAFTFEYPPAYKLIRIDMSNTSDSAYTTVGFSTASGSEVSEFYVYVWPTSTGMDTAGAVLDTLLSNASGVLTDYSLDRKDATTVNSQIAQFGYFTATQTDASVTTATGPAYYRVTVYIHGSWIIELDMTCGPSLKDTTQAEYDHLLQTFTALD
jgi:hypothetical protein